MNNNFRTLTTEYQDNLTILYARLSQDDGNAGDSNSIVNQKQILEDFAKKQHFSNCVFLADDGVSGTSFDRENFQKAIALVEAGKVKNFIVKDLSRFGRDYLKVGAFTEVIFPEKGVRFIAINNNIDSEKADDNSLAPFINLFNEWYARDTSKKIKAVKHMKGNAGEPIGGSLPYGYLKGENYRQTKKWLIDEQAAKNIRRIFEEFTGGKSKTEIAQGLTADKVKIPTAHKRSLGIATNWKLAQDDVLWSAEQVSQILSRLEYCGYLVNFKTRKPSYKVKKCVAVPRSEWKVFPNHHEAIISEGTYELAQSMMKTGQRRKKYNKVGLFTGLVYCMDCGHRHYFSGATEQYYCSGFMSRFKYDKMGSHLIKEKDLESLVLQDICRIGRLYQEHEAELLKFLKKQVQLEESRNQESDKNILIKSEKRLKALENLFAKLYEDNVSGKLTDTQFKKLSVRYEAEQQELEPQVQMLREKRAKYESKTDAFSGFIALLRRFTKPDELTANMVREFIERVEVGQVQRPHSKNRRQEIKIVYRFVGEIPQNINKEWSL